MKTELIRKSFRSVAAASCLVSVFTSSLCGAKAAEGLAANEISVSPEFQAAQAVLDLVHGEYSSLRRNLRDGLRQVIAEMPNASMEEIAAAERQYRRDHLDLYAELQLLALERSYFRAELVIVLQDAFGTGTLGSDSPEVSGEVPVTRSLDGATSREALLAKIRQELETGENEAIVDQLATPENAPLGDE